ncbi:hypothetical protein [Pinibacter aurantiacus]|uniref:Lipoprotein n=1 Tax=Pinibacter aurantiacus TaxID=2851599 RepID=A0A9E2W9P6_9BACT|nr:hypothetical protein [Pinibacter aurantiacus]MBV4360017.1 hypothetical protein [Pinibacter aurantiacus]
MKTRLLTSLLLSFIYLLTLSSCQKEQNDSSNYLFHNTDKYSIPFGTFTNKDGSGMQMALSSLDFHFTHVYIGPCYYVNIFLKDNSIADGRYTTGNFTFKSHNDSSFDSTKNFDAATVILNRTYQHDTLYTDGTTFNLLTNGTVSINKHVDWYDITYELHYGSELITGNFSGKLYNNNH